MDKISIAHQDANLRTVAVFDLYPDEVAKNETFASTAAVFKSTVEEINVLSVEAGVMPVTTATGKNTAREELEASCITIGSPLAVYAKQVNDVSLQDFLVLIPTALRRMRSTDFKIYGQSLTQYVTKYSGDISTVGITEAMQTELTERTETYSSLLEKPKQLINKRKIILASRKEKIDETIELINTLNLLIKTYDSDSPFVLAYLTASKVVDPATIHRKEEDDEEEMG